MAITLTVNGQTRSSVLQGGRGLTDRDAESLHDLVLDTADGVVRQGAAFPCDAPRGAEELAEVVAERGQFLGPAASTARRRLVQDLGGDWRRPAGQAQTRIGCVSSSAPNPSKQSAVVR